MEQGLITPVLCPPGVVLTMPHARAAPEPDPSTAFETFAAALIAKGHGLAALSHIFSVASDRILAEIVRLGLPTPHDQPFRASGRANAWTAGQMQQLVLLWSSGLFATCIGGRVGRSASSIRYKARWLGLPVRVRSTLRRVDVSVAIDIPLVAFPAERPPEPKAAWPPLRKRGPNLSHLLDVPESCKLIGLYHLTGVSHDVTAAKLGCRKIDIERRIKNLGLPNRSCLRGKLFQDYDPARPIVEQFRGTNYRFRETGCPNDPRSFWGSKIHHISPRLKASRTFQDLARGL